jgi:hypothetical protein
MKVNVQQDDIEWGVRRSSQNCPIANALHRETGMLAIVGVNRIALYGKNEDGTREPFKVWGDVPLEVIAFITMFDAHAHVEPFEFEL